MKSIVTKRLSLVPLSRENLFKIKEGEQCVVEDHMEIRLLEPVTLDVVLRAIEVKLSMMELVDVKDHPWLSFWLVVISGDQLSAGMIGFKGLPGETGEVEIGYGIDPVFRGRGYATEAARALAGWAFKDPRCHVIMGDAYKDNPASIRVMEKMGMKKHNETDEMVIMKIFR